MIFSVGELERMLDDSKEYDRQNLPPVVLKKFFKNHKSRKISDEDGAALWRNLIDIAKQLQGLKPDYPELTDMILGYQEFKETKEKGEWPDDHTALFYNQLVDSKNEITATLIDCLRSLK